MAVCLWKTVGAMNKRSSSKSLVDFKSLPRKRREAIRRGLYEDSRAGTTGYKAAKKWRIRPSSVYALYKRFKKEGEAAVEEKKRGPSKGPRAILGPSERDKLASAISRGDPRQLVLDFALWSSRAVVSYVRKKFGKSMSRQTARRLLRAMGFTYQCPVRHAREQNRRDVRKWLQTTYPAIRKLARRHGAAIFWADESSVMGAAVKCRGYSRRGCAPVLKAPANRSVRCNYIAAVDNRGKLYFRVFEGAMDADLFKEFIQGLLEETGHPVVLIVDNLKVHHANCLQDWFLEMAKAKKLWMRYLPSYSPELNPEEYLNRDVKADAAERAIPGSKEGMVEQTRSHLESRRGDPEAVKRIAFHHPAVRYAEE